jgi:hypothetical protein
MWQRLNVAYCTHSIYYYFHEKFANPLFTYYLCVEICWRIALIRSFVSLLIFFFLFNIESGYKLWFDLSIIEDFVTLGFFLKQFYIYNLRASRSS